MSVSAPATGVAPRSDTVRAARSLRASAVTPMPCLISARMVERPR